MYDSFYSCDWGVAEVGCVVVLLFFFVSNELRPCSLVGDTYTTSCDVGLTHASSSLSPLCTSPKKRR